MNTVFKIEGFFVDKHEDKVWNVDYMLTNESLDNIKSKILPEYINNTEETLGGNFLHHIDVVEIPLNRSVEYDEFVSSYTFLPNGELYIANEYRNLCGDSGFKGRNKDELPLKVGDKVEWIDGNESLHFGVVYALPPEVGEFEYLDAFDDCYAVLEGIDELPEDLSDKEYMLRHQHIDVNRVFKR